MKRIIPSVAIAVSLAIAFRIAVQASADKPKSSDRSKPEVIYGDDDRLDLYQIQDSRILQLADSTVALFYAERVHLSSDGSQAVLTLTPYGSNNNLCSEEPFYNQSEGAFCSGSLVGPDLVMTAGHCVSSAQECANTKFVFGFGIRQKGVFPESVAAQEVYGCSELLGQEMNDNGSDWALVRLDRQVPNHKPLEINRSNTIEKRAPLLVIGHPAGLPTKVAAGASVRDESTAGYFVANLDTYGGNSGSAVFNATTGLVEGILVRGELDYVYKNECRVSNVCQNEECRGEDVTRVAALANLIPVATSAVYNLASSLRRQPVATRSIFSAKPPYGASLAVTASFLGNVFDFAKE